MTHSFRFRGSDALAAMVMVCLATSWAFGQSENRTETGAAPTDLQLAGPANSAAPAPAAKIDIPTVDDAITRDAPKSQDLDSFIAGDPPAILDPDPARQGKAAPAADLSPKLPPEQQPSSELDATPQQPAPAHVVAKSMDDSDLNISAMEKRAARLESMIEAQSTILAEMTDELKAVRAEIAGLRQTFQTVARPDLDGGATDEPTSPAVGTLLVENRTSVAYTLNINGYDFIIVPGRREFPVEVGNIVTEIRGFEAPRAWNAKNFRVVNGQPQLAIQIH